ncbi:hypothetical protein FBZ89_104200 [Nitrospirillum amazonense]|uniref:Uncharacterized protein n=1 Tax=Nitrospirillum amazonense TaxID=28077 RepID=A0A560FK17_9PROT|nr:hypothetical protein [Nitrospirillum amazonense]TWB21952.1 hypothetical protein FBZ89_104200 [Nitrospirillum amazonense]
MKASNTLPAVIVHGMGIIVAVLGLFFAAGSTDLAGYIDGLLFVAFGVLVNFFTIARTIGGHADELAQQPAE